MKLELKKLRALRRSEIRSQEKLASVGVMPTETSKALLAEIEKRIAEELAA